MPYTAEFIKELPAAMQAEISTLAAQVDKLTKEKKKLKLPGDAVASFELVEANKVEAQKIIDDAKQKASEILVVASEQSSSMISNANKYKADIEEESAQIISKANQLKKEAESALDFAVRVNKTTEENKQLHQSKLAVFEQTRRDFYTLVKSIKDFLPNG